FEHFNEEGVNLQGSGIGLAFTKGLVELHHGKISVESTPEIKGQNGRTSFTVKIPLGKAHLKTEETIPDYQDSESISEYSYQEEDVKTSEVVATRSANVLANTEGSPVMLIVEDNKE